MSESVDEPVIWLEDGPRFVLADGSVVRLLVRSNGDELEFTGVDQGSALYARSGSDPEKIGVAVVDDPEAAVNLETDD